MVKKERMSMQLSQDCQSKGSVSDKLDIESNHGKFQLLQPQRKSAHLENTTADISSPMSSWLTPSSPKWPRSNNLHKTAHLDGLRGFAALLVYWHHHVRWVHNLDRLAQNGTLETSFGYGGSYYFATLPGIRLLFSGGNFAVSIFFVLSGYVLSIKPWRLIREDDMVGLIDHLSSAIFRRWFRLFLPVAVIMFAYATSWHVFGLWVDRVEPRGNWLHEMWFLYCDFKNFSFVFKEGGLPSLSYSIHVWSIPLELKGSMVVFASILVLSRCTSKAQLWCQAVLIGYFMYVADNAWYCAMFVAGMLMSHLDGLAAAGELPDFMARLKPYKTTICYYMLAAGIYLGGVPCDSRGIDQLAKNRGWYFLSLLKPQAVLDYRWFYLFWASILVVASTSHIQHVRRLFETRFCQYIGRISFALYLVHGPLLWTIGDRLYASVGFTSKAHLEHIPYWVNKFELPLTGAVGLELGFLAVQLIMLPTTLILADLVMRTVEKPSVEFAAWAYDNIFHHVPQKHS